jgi:hypothetical protein
VSDTPRDTLTDDERKALLDVFRQAGPIEVHPADIFAAVECILADRAASTVQTENGTHGNNHAPLPKGTMLDPGYCEGCDRERDRGHVASKLDEAIAKWEDRGPTSLTVALLAEAAYAARAALDASPAPTEALDPTHRED